MRVDPKLLNYSSLPEKKRKKAKNGKTIKSNWWDEAFYGEVIDPTDPSKRRQSPYMPSNTFARSGTQDADMQKLAQFDDLSDEQQNLMNDRYMTDQNNQNTEPKPRRQYQGNTFGGVSLAPIIGGALGAINNLIPDDTRRRQLFPQTSYNPYAYGTGSQAIMEHGGYIPGEDENNSPMAKDGKWIQKAVNPKHKGYCTPMTKKTCTPRRKALAKTFKKHHGFHEDGGIIPDPMSVFNPHNYEDGGNVNGGAKIREVGANYPNADLMEQWLLYQDGGPVDPPGKYGNRPIMVNNPNDPRIAAYQDSLSAYNQFYANRRKAIDLVQKGKERDILGYDNSVGAKDWRQTQFNPLETQINPLPNSKVKPSKIYKEGQQPILATREFGTGFGLLDDLVGTDNFNLLAAAEYQKPVQPYEYQPATRPSVARNRRREHGGNVNGGAKIREVGADYPNADLMEQWLLYRDGGQLSSSKAKEMLRDGTANGKKLTKKQKRYFGMVAAGKAANGDSVNGNGDPTPQDAYYEANARLAHYKERLNNKLKAKNPKAFGDYFSQLAPLRRSGNTAAANKYVQEAGYNEYLSPQEVRGELGDEYDSYVNSIRTLNDYNVSQGKEPLYGNIEGQNDVANLNYGRRFASLTVTPTLDVSNISSGKKYSRRYSYNPKTRNVDYTETGDTSLRPDYISANNRPAPTISFKQGGVMYNDGGDVRTLWGGDAEIAAYNPYDGGTVEFTGASHDDGGIGMTYNGNPVEVEGGEFAARDADGNMNIFGNMNFPGSKTKFKTVAKAMAEKEKRYDFLKSRGSQLVNSANPADKYEQLTFNAGQLMMHGGTMGQKDIAKKKQNLSALQKAMLDTASEFGLDAGDMSRGKMKKAKGGASIPFFQNGGENDPTRSDRNNNPGNIRWGKWIEQNKKKYGKVTQDKDGFIVFENREVGRKAMRDLLRSENYKGKDITTAIRDWTGGHPYRYDLSSLKNKKVGDLSDQELNTMMDTMTKGEGTRYGLRTSTPTQNTIPTTPPAPDVPKYTLPPSQLVGSPEAPRPRTVEPPPLESDFPGDRPPIPSNEEMLDPRQLLGEMYAFATNDVEPVHHLRYDPLLHTPFQMSFQDRLNENQASFSALQRSIGPGNPSALGVLAAQKYQADNAVRADEFRTNQAIANDVTNKNVGILNDAQLKNLALTDTQQVRQSEARSKTKALNQMIFNSVSDKFMKNQYDNRRLAAYENLYDYRFVPGEKGGLQATYYGPDAMFNFDGSQSGRAPADKRTITRYDQYGNMKGYSEYDDYDLREQERLLNLEMKRRNLPLLSAPKLQ